MFCPGEGLRPRRRILRWMPELPSAVDRLVKFLPAIVVVIVGVTATALVGIIGVIALAIIWTLLVAFIALTFAAKWLRDLRILTQERDDLRSRLAEMEGRPRTDPTEVGQVNALQVEVQSWKTKALQNQRE